MVSCGLLSTHDEVAKCLNVWDTDNSGNISFDEFVDALKGNEMVDKSKLDLLRKFSTDPHFRMDTLLTAERRKRLLYLVLERTKVCQRLHDDAVMKINAAISKNSHPMAYTILSRELQKVEKTIELSQIENNVYFESLAVVLDHTSKRIATANSDSPTSLPLSKSNTSSSSSLRAHEAEKLETLPPLSSKAIGNIFSQSTSVTNESSKPSCRMYAEYEQCLRLLQTIQLLVALPYHPQLVLELVLDYLVDTFRR